MSKKICIMIEHMLLWGVFLFLFYFILYILDCVFSFTPKFLFNILSFGIFHGFDTDAYIKVRKYILHSRIE